MSELILDSIFFYYPDLKVLRGAYLEVKQNSITCLVGKNGSGKSTLFDVAAGQLQADSGITQINGIRLHRASKSRRYKYIGYLPQQSFLPKSLKVKDVIGKSEASRDRFIVACGTTKSGAFRVVNAGMLN